LRSTNTEQMLEYVLDEILVAFDCDRTWLVDPCMSDDAYFQVHAERSLPEFPGAWTTEARRPLASEVANIFQLALSSSTPLAFDLHGNHAAEILAAGEVDGYLHVKSQLMVRVHLCGLDHWILGIQHCRFAVDYSDAERLFRAIAQRIADGITTIHAESLLVQSEERFATLVHNAPEAVVILDCDKGIYTDVNAKAEILFGRSREELVNKMGPVSLSPEYQPNGISSEDAAPPLIKIAVDGGFPTFEWDHLHSSGRIVPCQITLAYLPYPTRNLLRGSLTDITELKLAEEERRELEARLVQSQKMEAIGNLTGGIAHDFNNLLTIVLGHLDLLELDSGNEKHVLENIEQIRSASERASALTHRLLAFARRQPLRPKALHAARKLKGMEELLRSSLGETVSIEVILVDGLWLCMADEAQIENAILNLAINARDAMPDGGNLTIEAGNANLDPEYARSHADLEPGQYVVISVTDTGIGMEPDVLEQAPTPFFTTKPIGKGTGLGLSMVYGFVKQSGGHFKIYSEVGLGTTVNIYLPRSFSSEEKDGIKADSLVIRRGKGQLILVVEDEYSVLALTKTLLSHLGYKTLEASNGADALRLIDQYPNIKLLLTDVVLGGDMNGAELAVKALEARPDLGVLYMSGYTADALLHHGTVDSHITLLEKPFSQRSLALHVQKFLTN
jgi:PAS domain S-box-containing protein